MLQKAQAFCPFFSTHEILKIVPYFCLIYFKFPSGFYYEEVVLWQGRGGHMEEVLWTRGQTAQLQLQLWPVLTGIDGQPHESSDLWRVKNPPTAMAKILLLLVEEIREIIFII